MVTNPEIKTMELGLFVFLGIITQVLITKASKKSGAVFGYFITTLILTYGLIAYGKKGFIELAGIEFSSAGFIIICLIWYGIDTYQVVYAIRSKLKLNEAKEGYDAIIKKYGPYQGGIMEWFFNECIPYPQEYLITIGEKGAVKDRGWFILTNFRLFIKNGITNEMQQITLHEIENFTISQDPFRPCVFRHVNSVTIEVKGVEIVPNKKYLRQAIEMSKSYVLNYFQ